MTATLDMAVGRPPTKTSPTHAKHPLPATILAGLQAMAAAAVHFRALQRFHSSKFVGSDDIVYVPPVPKETHRISDLFFFFYCW
jgi:hypothetical protein